MQESAENSNDYVFYQERVRPINLQIQQASQIEKQTTEAAETPSPFLMRATDFKNN